MVCKDVRRRLKREILVNKRTGTVQDFCEILGCNDTVAVFSALAILESEGKVELRELQKSYREDGGAVFQGVHGISSEYLCDELFSKIERMDKKYAEKCGLDLGKMSEVNRCLRQEIISKWRS